MCARKDRFEEGGKEEEVEEMMIVVNIVWKGQSKAKPTNRLVKVKCGHLLQSNCLVLGKGGGGGGTSEEGGNVVNLEENARELNQN